MANTNNIGKPKFNFTWFYIIIGAILLSMYIFGDGNNDQIKEVEYSKLKEHIENGYIEEITVLENGEIEAYVKEDKADKIFDKKSEKKGARYKVVSSTGSIDNFDDFITEMKEPDAQGKKKFEGTLTYDKDSGFLSGFLWNIAPFLIILGIWIFIMRRMSGGAGGQGGVFNVGKSQAKLFDKDNAKAITFKDVAGQEGAKQEVKEIVDFLKNPKIYTELGGKIPKGALLVGPPGTGKTLLAKAVAGEANVPFFSMSGSDFVEMFVGVGASRVRDLFRQAKEKAPCIVFIDEIDAVGRARGKNPSMGGNDERENTLNQLLTEMDGFGTNSGIIVIAATNRADILDKALLRAGRFDRQIHVDLPDLNERKEVFGVHLRPLKLDPSVDVDILARQTPGFSGADIANVCNEAALIAARQQKKAIDKQDFLDAIDRIIGGLEKKTKILTQKEKEAIAIHEAGHATISWFLEHANPLIKVTIVPRGRALGAAWYMPEERQITTKEQMLDEMCSILGGRAAEETFIGHISTGAMNDLERVTKQAYAMVAYAGMSERLSNLCYYNNQEFSFNRPYSEKTAEAIDSEVHKMITEQYERAKELLMEHKEGHAELARILIEKEVLFAEDVEKIFGKRPWASRSEEIFSNEENNKEETAGTAESETAESDPEITANDPSTPNAETETNA
ncbi:MAG: ATP-dependent zinc metalloprotease FtsH [Bacteroidaceae bacterium]|nr:ATP-dependent zinc metalloprotease FtsH [Bacteroidaceae bacterium]